MKTFATVKQPKDSKLCGAACVAMICGYDLDALYRALSSMHPGRFPFTLEEQLESEDPYFCHMIDIAYFLASEGYLVGQHAQALNAENGGRMALSDATDLTLTIQIADSPALVGVDSEKYPGKLHWVLWDGKAMRDPSPEQPDTRPLSDYDNRIYDWIPLIRLEPFE